MRLAVFFSAMLLVCGCSGGGAVDTHTPVGTPVSLTVFNGLFAGYTTARTGTQVIRIGPQLSFNNMTGSFAFTNMTGINSRGRCTGSYTAVATGPTIFENLSTTKATASLQVLTGPTAPTSVDWQRYFLISNGNLYKITNVPGTTSYQAANFTMPPNPANVGDFGSIATLAGTDGSTLYISWELSPEFFGNSIMIVTSITRNIANIVTATEVDRFYLDRSGNPYKLSVTYTSGGVSITLTGAKT